MSRRKPRRYPKVVRDYTGVRLPQAHISYKSHERAQAHPREYAPRVENAYLDRARMSVESHERAQALILEYALAHPEYARKYPERAHALLCEYARTHPEYAQAHPEYAQAILREEKDRQTYLTIGFPGLSGNSTRREERD